MRRFLPELVAIPLLPLLIVQGVRTRRITPRLPEAAGPTSGLAGGGLPAQALSLLTLGESPVAGVGVDTHEIAITGQLAQALAVRWQRPVKWRACGKNGVTARQALQEVLTRIPPEPVDLAMVAFGVNDTTAFRSVSAWKRDLVDVLDALDASCRPRLVMVSGVPPVALFPALPQPLRWVMGMKAEVLDIAARDVASTRPRTVYVPLALDTKDSAMMASDGYHPSARGCAAWAQLLAGACPERIG